MSADDLRAQSGFADTVKTKLAQSAADLFEADAGEVRRKTGGDRGVEFLFAVQKLFEPRQVSTDLFGVSGTNFYTFAAGNAVFGNDGSFAVDDADGFAMAVPDAFVTVLTLVFNSKDRIKHNKEPFIYIPGNSV